MRLPVRIDDKSGLNYNIARLELGIPSPAREGFAPTWGGDRSAAVVAPWRE